MNYSCLIRSKLLNSANFQTPYLTRFRLSRQVLHALLCRRTASKKKERNGSNFSRVNWRGDKAPLSIEDSII